MTTMPPPPPEASFAGLAPAIAPPVPDIEDLPKPKPAPRGAPKWETDTKDQIRAALRRFSKPLQDLIARDANEGDTRMLVTDFLTMGLGYDKYSDLTTEYQVKGEFADYGVRIEQQLVAFIEVKRCTTRLNEKHLRQVQNYAANEGVEWMVLTNGVHWQAYHLTGGLPLVADLAVDVNLLDDTPMAQKISALFYLSRESLKRRQIDQLWQTKRITSPASLAATLVSEKLIDELRKELRRVYGYNADAAELLATVRSEVIAPGLLAS